MKTPRLPLNAPLLALATLLLVACEGPDRKALMDEVRYSVPPMAADEKFFDGEVIAHLSLGSNVGGAALFGGHEGGGNNKLTGFKGNAGEKNFGAAGGMGSSAMGASEMGGNTGGGEAQSKLHAEHSGTYQGNVGMSHIADSEEGESPAARRAREAQMPPALLRLRLENPGGATVVVQIRDINSELGDFAPRPDTVTLESGQSVELEPMQSLLGLQSYALPVTITLRAAGQTESKVLTLRPVQPAAAAPAPAAK